MPKYYAGAKFEEEGREHSTNPTELLIESFMAAKSYYEQGCKDVMLYIIDEQGVCAGIPYSNIENLGKLDRLPF